jgi:hypothetical protein
MRGSYSSRPFLTLVSGPELGSAAMVVDAWVNLFPEAAARILGIEVGA